ncbi:unnamed protein product [Trichogramma brassicae]|uniref:C2H2-type domain-containing protein n=1 Tax=Trichogramma brassicae TaxID=86971 RepID=A0A6H5IKS4_9HYME|nr:unnamed protein product [Trichogramma brassicae]
MFKSIYCGTSCKVNQGVKNNELPLLGQHMMPRVMYARTQGARCTAASIFSASFVQVNLHEMYPKSSSVAGGLCYNDKRLASELEFTTYEHSFLGKIYPPLPVHGFEVEDNSSGAAARHEHVLSHTDAARSPPKAQQSFWLSMVHARMYTRDRYGCEYMQSCVRSWYASRATLKTAREQKTANTSLGPCRTCTAYAEGGSTRFIVAADALSVYMRANCSSMPNYLCDDCGTKFGSKWHLLLHKTAVHEVHRDFACDKCEKKFGHKSDLLKHQKTVHEGRKDYPCDNCEKKFGERGNLIKHQNTFHEGRKDYACENCEKKFGNSSNMRRHQNIVHDNRRDFACDKCKKKFAQKWYLLVHQRTVHENRRNYACDYCEKKFGHKQHWLDHQMTIHEGRKDFACNNCEKKFGNKSNLLKHQRIIHEGRIDYVCGECGKKFGLECNLLTHQKTIHEGRKDFACDKCEKKYGQKSDLLKHQRIVHEGRKDYACDKCEKKFGRKSTLLLHRRTVHEGRKDFACNMCEKTFGHKCNLFAHQKTVHEGRREYACDECMKKFGQRVHLLVHQRTVHEDRKDYVCDKCEKKHVTYMPEENLNKPCSLVRKQFCRGEDAADEKARERKRTWESRKRSWAYRWTLRKCQSLLLLLLQKKDVLHGGGIDQDSSFIAEMARNAVGTVLAVYSTHCKKISGNTPVREAQHLSSCIFGGPLVSISRTHNLCDLHEMLCTCGMVQGSSVVQRTHLARSARACFKLAFTRLSDGSIRFSEISNFHRENRHQTLRATYVEKFSTEKSLGPCRTCTAYAEGGSTRFIVAADALSVYMRANCSSMPNYLCDDCGTKFGSKWHLLLHKTAVHEVHRDFACDKCEKKFGHKSDLLKHQKTVHEGRKDYPCDNCEKKFGERGNLIKHQNTFHEGRKDYACENCEKKFGNSSNMRRHQNIVHDNRRDFACDKCKKKFAQKWYLLVHQRTVHENRRNYACDYCEKKFGHKQHWLDHQMTIHEGRKDFACNNCEKKFGNKSNLLKHQRIIHEGRIDYVCGECGKKFGLECNLLTHQKTIHEGRKDFACDKCEKKYGQKSDLLKHQRIVHEGRKDYACDKCEKKFGRKSTLLLHRRTVHEGRKDFACNMCEKTFGHKCNLFAHQKTVHEGRREYACDECMKKFGQRVHLLVHQRTVHEDRKDYVCDKCEKNNFAEVKMQPMRRRERGRELGSRERDHGRIDGHFVNRAATAAMAKTHAKKPPHDAKSRRARRFRLHIISCTLKHSWSVPVLSIWRRPSTQFGTRAYYLYTIKKQLPQRSHTNYLEHVLSNRDFVIWNGSITSDFTFNITEGLMQGTVNSPILFNIFTHGVCNLAGLNQGDGTYSLAFADDYVLLVADKDPQIIERKIQHLATEINKYYTNWNLKINTQISVNL